MRALVVLLFVSNLALADEGGLLKCRAIKDAAARLACYDGLPVASSAGRPAAGAPVQAAPAASAAAPSASARFGLEEKQAAPALSAIDSHIEGRFEGWGPKSKIRLANGQVWRIADGSSGALWIENPKVRVRRGLLGAFYLDIESTNRSPRVTREQ